MFKRVLISKDEQEISVALFEDDDMVQFYHDSDNEKNFVGNIYKGKVTGIVSGLQAAFVDIGIGKNTFLHLQDVNFDLIENLCSKAVEKKKKTEKDKEKKKHSKAIEDVLSVGQDVIVQVTKEEIKDKGARATTNISIPGRYMVCLPYQEGKGGVSRKIIDTDERKRLKDQLKDVQDDKVGFIVRTAGTGIELSLMQVDSKMLSSQWRSIEKKFKQTKLPSLLYNDHDIVYRLIRDIFTEDIDEIYIDNNVEYKKMARLLDKYIPSLTPKLIFYHSQKKLFDKFDVYKEIQKAIRRKIWLKSGGYLIIDEAEALTAIDVNTGRFTGKDNQEETILKTNLESARLIARLLRLRDIGGIIVIDFIDMAHKDNKQKVLDVFKNELKKDNSKICVSNISEFGLVEMTRKRVRESLKSYMFTECPDCNGSGQILTDHEVWKRIQNSIDTISYEVPKPKGLIVHLNPKIKEFIETECASLVEKQRKSTKFEITFDPNEAFHLNFFEVEKLGLEITEASAEETIKPAKKKRRRNRKSKKIETPTDNIITDNVDVIDNQDSPILEEINLVETEVQTESEKSENLESEITVEELIKPVKKKRRRYKKKFEKPSDVIKTAETDLNENKHAITKADIKHVEKEVKIEVEKSENEETAVPPIKKVPKKRRYTRWSKKKTEAKSTEAETKSEPGNEEK